MSAEANKILCAILSAILLLLLSSFISDLLYHHNDEKINLSYVIEDEVVIASEKNLKKDNKTETISSELIKQLLLNASLEEGKNFAAKNCNACHSFNLPIQNKIGPSLANVMDRKIAAVDDYKYSKTLKNIDDEWTYKNLYLFLENPKGWAPGTKMSYRGIKKKDDLIGILKYLSHITKLNES